MTEIATTTSTITAIWLAARKIYNTLYYFTADQRLFWVVLVRLLQTAPEFTHEYAHLTVLVVTSLLLLPSCSLRFDWLLFNWHEMHFQAHTYTHALNVFQNRTTLHRAHGCVGVSKRQRLLRVKITRAPSTAMTNGAAVPPTAY